jgi:hypothetical protein
VAGIARSSESSIVLAFDRPCFDRTIEGSKGRAGGTGREAAPAVVADSLLGRGLLKGPGRALRYESPNRRSDGSDCSCPRIAEVTASLCVCSCRQPAGQSDPRASPAVAARRKWSSGSDSGSQGDAPHGGTPTRAQLTCCSLPALGGTETGFPGRRRSSESADGPPPLTARRR